MIYVSLSTRMRSAREEPRHVEPVVTGWAFLFRTRFHYARGLLRCQRIIYSYTGQQTEDWSFCVISRLVLEVPLLMLVTLIVDR
jgi:hypothetical protein